ncbi:MAG TPA: DUF262 domain-containing protein [Candidatus Saccharimonadales bacterium]|nr:DUF262 domain-containing protein [Candidatus Saccharimonadales bacterium]
MKLSKKEEQLHLGGVVDESEKDNTAPVVRYEITSYGADYDVAGFVARLERNDIVVPPFQRDYVWRITEASRFIESLLLGLPVPGVFLAKDPDSNRLLVIDGQQRLKTLQFFLKGVFNPKPNDKTNKVFELTNLSSRFDGLTYRDLPEADRRHLDDYVIHATIVKQDKPTNNDTSIYHIFERINATGQRLTPQEIRVAVYHGCLFELLEELNEDSNWRKVFGKPNARLKDRELILRFLAFYFEADSYERPLGEFLNKFAAKHRSPKENEMQEFRDVFCKTIEVVCASFGTDAFRPERALNAAVFDSVMVGIARRLKRGHVVNPDDINIAYRKLLKDEGYLATVSQSTADESTVEKRLKLATQAFAHV